MRTRLALASLFGAAFALFISLPCPGGEALGKKKVDDLIGQLGSGDFSEREKATKELAAIGVPALDALRKAAKSEDAEVRKRAEELLPKIERQAESARVLAPKHVHLVYKDTPLPEALADFQKKSGYSMELHDPDGKLKERKITLDTGETTFWHAFALFCEKAELSEASLADWIQDPQPPGGGAPPPRAAKKPLPAGAPVAPPAFPGQALMPRKPYGMPGMHSANAQLLLKAGKPQKLPTDDRGAIRIRALTKSDMPDKAPEGEIILPLEISPEPKLQWEVWESVHIHKALDDRGQNLTQVFPQVEGVVGPGGRPADAEQIRMRLLIMQKQRQMQRQMRMQQMRMQMQRGGRTVVTMGGDFNLQVPVQLKKGAKESKLLKELKGSITAQLFTEAQPMIVADKLKAGETAQGKEGGYIKIADVKSEDEQTTIRVEFEQPPFDKVQPVQANVAPGFAAVRMAPAVQKMPVPPVAVQGRLVIKGGGMQFYDSVSGLSVLNDQGKALPVGVQMENRFQQQAGGGFKQTTTYLLTCRHEKGKGKPVKIVFLGRKRATVEVPFLLKDVPLP